MDFRTTSEILNNSVIQSGHSLAQQIASPFPSPFVYEKNSYIYIPVTSQDNAYVQFNVYTIDMSLVYASNQIAIYFNGQKVIKWNGKNAGNKELSTGVYIYVVKTGNNTSTGKFAIIR